MTGKDRTVSRLFSEDHRGFGPHGEHMAPKGTEIPSGLRPSLKSPFQELAVQYLNLMFRTSRTSTTSGLQSSEFGVQTSTGLPTSMDFRLRGLPSGLPTSTTG